MNINLIFGLIVLVGIIWFCTRSDFLKSFELFNPVSSNQQYGPWEQDYKSDKSDPTPEYYSQLDFKKVPTINCCLIEKKYIPDSSGMYFCNFSYLYTKKSGSECNPIQYNLDSNTQVLIDGDNGWSNEYCTMEKEKLGSCRNINKECIDFVDKNFCNKYRMTWSAKTCHQPLEYTWIDPIKIELPSKKPTDGTFKMF